MTAKNPEAFAPGEYISEELEARGWSQLDLAEILGRPAQAVNEIIKGKRAITPDTARGLANAFGNTAQVWLNLQSAYDLSRLQQSDENLVSRKARLYGFAPVGEMQKRGWIEKSSNFDMVEAQVLRFFELESLDDSEPPQFLAAARKSTDGDWTPPQHAWLMKARHMARAAQVVGRFTAKAFQGALQALSLLKTDPEEIRKIPRVLSEAGIRFLIVAPLPQSKIDGACFWLSDHEPVVVVSFRYDRIDWFWHTLMHELGHIANGDGKRAATVDVQLVGNDAISGDKPEIEKKADAFAVAFLIDQNELADFLRRTHVFSRVKVVGFARRLGVNPGIVVGQLQHRGLIPYTHFRMLLTSVRNLIIGSASTDGWSVATAY